MLDVHQSTLDRAVKALAALERGTSIRWSISIDDKTYGNAELAVPKTSSRNYKYKRGETSSYYMPFLESLEVGDSVEIPFGRFDPRTLSTNIGSKCWALWGTGSHTLKTIEHKGVVQVLRIA